MPVYDDGIYYAQQLDAQQRKTMQEIAQQLQGLQTELEQKTQAREDDRIRQIVREEIKAAFEKWEMALRMRQGIRRDAK